MHKDEIKLILGSNSEMTEENYDKTDEDGDVKGQAPVLLQWEVYKQNLVNGPLSGGVHNNTDDTSDDDVIPTPLAPQGISKWAQVMGQTNNIHLFTGDMTGDRMWPPTQIIGSTPNSVFMLYWPSIVVEVYSLHTAMVTARTTENTILLLLWALPSNGRCLQSPPSNRSICHNTYKKNKTQMFYNKNL
jgi:hypothetical protein